MDTESNRSTQQHGKTTVSLSLKSVSHTTIGHLTLAKQLFKSGRLPLALAEIDRALEANPELSLAHFLRGVIHIKFGELETARQSLQDAVRWQHDLYQAWVMLAHVERDLGHPDEALRMVSRAIDINARNPRAHMLRGALLETLHRIEEAAEAYRNAVQSAPHLMTAHYKLGSVLLQLGDAESAERQIAIAHQLNPLNRSSILLLGDLKLGRGAAEEAIPYYKAAIDLDPLRGAVAQAKLGLAFYRLGWFQEAMVALRAAVQLDPVNVDSYLLLGRILQHLGHPAEALRMLEKAVEIDERYPEAQELLEAARSLTGDGATDTAADPDHPARCEQQHVGIQHRGGITECDERPTETR